MRRIAENTDSIGSTAGSTRENSQDGSLLQYVPGGQFRMGSLRYSNESPPHLVAVRPFWISRTTITNRMYQRFRQETGHRMPAYGSDANYSQDQQPVVGIDHADATAYCKWAGGRLPTEAEWEFSARGTDGRVYPWGNAAPTPALAVYGRIYGKGGRAAEVGTHPGDVSPFGVLDMAGNVLEWCADWAGPYPGEFEVGPKGPPQGSNRIMRGGCWVYQEESLVATTRFFSVPHQKVSFAGFRIVVDVPDTGT